MKRTHGMGEREFQTMLSFKAEAGIVPLVCWVHDELYPEYLRMWRELKKANDRIYELEFGATDASQPTNQPTN